RGAGAHPPQGQRPGKEARIDYEYERKGVSNQFMRCEPLRGWRHVRVTARRTRRDYADCIRALLEVHYPRAEKVRLVQDNLNTHSGGRPYQAVPAAAARPAPDPVPVPQ